MALTVPPGTSPLGRFTRLSGLSVTVVSAALMAMTFPPWSFHLLAWVALVPLFVAVRRASMGWAFLFSCLWIVLFASLAGDWFPRAVSTYYQQPWIVGLAFFAGVTSTMGAPYYIAFTAAYRALARGTGRVLPLLAAAAWVAAELARGRLFTGSPVFIGNPWGLLGYAQVGVAPLVQIADLTGIYGVSFVVAAVNAALAEVWLAYRRENVSLRVALRELLVAAVPGALALTYGLAVLHGGAATDRDGPAATVAVVQGNLDLGSTWRADLYGRNLDVYLRLTRDVIADRQPRVVFWPEGAMTFFLESEPLYRQAIATVLQGGRVELVAGGPRAVGSDNQVYFNSIFLVEPDGGIRAHYDKQYLVPFAEYFPLAGLDFLRRRFERVRVFTPGAPTAPLPTAAGPAGIVNCNEAMLPEVVGTRVAQGAAYLVNPSNDSWLHDPKYAAQQFDIVLMRAIEQRRYLIRASTSGPSAIVDPWGRVVVHTPALTRDVIAGTIQPRTGVTLYGRIGDAFAFGCIGIVAVAVVRARRRMA